jgi:hypothetical protein
MGTKWCQDNVIKAMTNEKYRSLLDLLDIVRRRNESLKLLMLPTDIGLPLKLSDALEERNPG